jgi:hypothetical protein
VGTLADHTQEEEIKEKTREEQLYEVPSNLQVHKIHSLHEGCMAHFA